MDFFSIIGLIIGSTLCFINYIAMGFEAKHIKLCLFVKVFDRLLLTPC